MYGRVDRGGSREGKKSLRKNKIVLNDTVNAIKKGNLPADSGPVYSQSPPPLNDPRHGCAIVDSLCHLLNRQFDSDQLKVLQRASYNGVEAFIIMTTDPDKLELAQKLSKQNEGTMYYLAGLHTDMIKRNNDKVSTQRMDQLKEFALKPEAVGIICGLDFGRDVSIRYAQERLFESQLALAAEVQLPLVVFEVHAAETLAEKISIFKSTTSPAYDRPIAVYNFCGSAVEMSAFIALDMYFILTGRICDPTATGDTLRECIKNIPLNRLLLASDSPFTTPQNISDFHIRESRNEPANLTFVLSTLAEVYGLTLRDAASTVRANSKRFYGLLDTKEYKEETTEAEAVADGSGIHISTQHEQPATTTTSVMSAETKEKGKKGKKKEEEEEPTKMESKVAKSDKTKKGKKKDKNVALSEEEEEQQQDAVVDKRTNRRKNNNKHRQEREEDEDAEVEILNKKKGKKKTESDNAELQHDRHLEKVKQTNAITDAHSKNNNNDEEEEDEDDEEEEATEAYTARNKNGEFKPAASFLPHDVDDLTMATRDMTVRDKHDILYACKVCRHVLFSAADLSTHVAGDIFASGRKEFSNKDKQKKQKKRAGKNNTTDVCTMLFVQSRLPWMKQTQATNTNTDAQHEHTRKHGNGKTAEEDEREEGEEEEEEEEAEDGGFGGMNCEGKLSCPYCQTKLGRWNSLSGIYCSCGVLVPAPTYKISKSKMDIIDRKMDVEAAVSATLLAYHEQPSEEENGDNDEEERKARVKKGKIKVKSGKGNFTSFRNKDY